MDSGVEEGKEVPVTYDPLLAKVTAWAETREAAIDRAIAALRNFPVLGIRTNIGFMIRILDHADFRRGKIHTGFIEEHLAELNRQRGDPREAAGVAVRLRSGASHPSYGETRDANASLGRERDPWSTLTGWGR